MLTVLALTWRSLLNRRYTVLLSVLSIALSVALLLGVERLRHQARESFANTLSDTDLVVGARSSPVQLLLYAVFRIGDATNPLSWASWQSIIKHEDVAWVIPISLGDSHRGFRVLGTTDSYLEHYRYAQKQPLEFQDGVWFDDLYDVVIGAAVASELDYRIGDSIVLSHGAGEVSFVEHADKPFVVTGIFKRTGTPVDRTVHTSLEAIDALHIDENVEATVHRDDSTAGHTHTEVLEPESITAGLIGLKSKATTFRVQRYINEYPDEALSAVLPGVGLRQLWGLVAIAENALLMVSACVVLVGVSGMVATLLSNLNARRREMAILRSVGARPAHVFGLFIGEALLTTALGIALGLMLLHLARILSRPLLEARFGLAFPAKCTRPWRLATHRGDPSGRTICRAAACLARLPALSP